MPSEAITTAVLARRTGIRRVQYGKSAATSGGTASFTLNGCVAGNQILVGIVLYDAAATITSVTCSGESNLTAAGSLYRAGSGILSDAAIQFYYLPSITAAGDKLLTLTLSASVSGCFGGWEISGGDSTAFFEGQATAAVANVNITTASNKAGIFFIGISGGGPSVLPPCLREYLAQPLQNNALNYWENAASIGTYNVGFTSSGSQIILAGSFKTKYS